MATIAKGTRVQIPAWHDAWMRGARYGEVTRVYNRDNGASLDRHVSVKLDKLPRKRFQFRICDVTPI